MAGLVFAAMLSSSCYVMQQGYGQLAMLAARQPIARVLARPDLAPETREQLSLVWYAKRYAEQNIGLRASQSYNHVVWLDRGSTSYGVAAAPADRLEPHLWCFPVAGCLPYLGYFNRADADRERARLTALGFDVWVRGVSAHSLGGWFPDPVYSPMLADGQWYLANTVIHELTHGTVFISGRAQFNESLATFVGDRGALMFLEQRYGRDSQVLRNARAGMRDQTLYVAFLDGLIGELRTLYASSVPREEKLRRRAEIFAASRLRAAGIPFETRGYARRSQQEINNAYLATHTTYHGSQGQFEQLYGRLGSDLRRFVTFVRTEVAQQRDPDSFIAHWLEAHPGGERTRVAAP